MPSVWSWYQIVEARWSFGYWNTAVPGSQAIVPGAAKPWAEALLWKKSYHVPTVAKSGSMLRRDGEVPRLGVAVALVADTNRAVHVRHDRHRAGVRPGRAVERRSHVASRDAAGRVGPVQRRIDGQQVGQERRARIGRIEPQLVDPLHAHRPLPLGLDRERRRVVDQQALLGCRLDRPVAPDGRGRLTGGQDLLRDLPHRDLVVVDGLATGLRIVAAFGMTGGTSSGVTNFGSDDRVERGPDRKGERAAPTEAREQEAACARDAELEEERAEKSSSPAPPANPSPQY